MRNTLARAAVLCLMMAATTVFLANARRAETPAARQSFDSFPMTLDGWQARIDPPLSPEILKVLGVDDYLSRAYYRSDGAAVGLYMGFYGSQRQGDTIHSPLNCLPGAGWEPLSEGRLELQNVDGAGRSIIVNRYVVQKGLERNLVLYWYHGRGRVIASEYVSRAMLIRDAMFTNQTNGSLVRVLAPVDGADETHLMAAEHVATDFVRTLFPTLDPYLP
jgi:EpsI family protein